MIGYIIIFFKKKTHKNTTDYQVDHIYDEFGEVNQMYEADEVIIMHHVCGL